MKPTLLAIVLVALGTTAMAQFPPFDQLRARADLPDPLVALDGTKISNKDEWLAKRKPELKKLFQHYMYGQFPEKPANAQFKVERVDPKALGGKATLKEITISFGPPETPKIHMLLVVPNKRSGPAPVFLGLNFNGNHTTINDPNVSLPTNWVPGGRKGVKNNRATDEGRGSDASAWSMEQLVDAGYAVATVYCGDIVSDRSDKKEGIQNFIKTGHDAAHDWGAIAAWAWGLERCIDYLLTDPDLDANRIILFGHSRLGKTALLAAAFDERAAMVIPNQAGCGGTSPSRSRNPKSETVKVITTRFPHWFTPTFAKFSDAVDKIPFDQHCLIALMAPRPVLLNNATEDQWANPDGQFDMLLAADPVYKLFGSEGVAAKERPAVGRLLTSPLGYRIRAGKHSVTPEDWQAFVDYANVRLKK